jgi:hypothetical protein
MKQEQPGPEARSGHRHAGGGALGCRHVGAASDSSRACWDATGHSLGGVPGLVPVPLTLLAQRTGTTVSDPGLIDHAQAAIAFTAAFLGQEQLVRRTADGPVGLESEVLAREAPGLPDSSDHRRPIALLLITLGESRSKLRRAQWVGSSSWPSSRRRFQVHWLITCQASCPAGAWLHQRSGSIS